MSDDDEKKIPPNATYDDKEDEEDEENKHEDDGGSFAFLKQLFDYKDYEFRNGHWVFFDCELNDHAEPLKPGTKVAYISVNFNTGHMTMVPEETFTPGQDIVSYRHQLILAAIPLETPFDDVADLEAEVDE